MLRCLVPECDKALNPKYDEPWVKYAVPELSNNVQDHFQPSQCQKYLANSSLINGTCFDKLFTWDVVDCNEWVFDSERTIVNEVSFFLNRFINFINRFSKKKIVEHNLLGKSMEIEHRWYEPFCRNHRRFRFLRFFS